MWFWNVESKDPMTDLLRMTGRMNDARGLAVCPPPLPSYYHSGSFCETHRLPSLPLAPCPLAPSAPRYGGNIIMQGRDRDTCTQHEEEAVNLWYMFIYVTCARR